jgi:sRNA-binding regulator protein Hfq
MPNNVRTRGRGKARPAGPRTPPPEATGAEVRYLNEVKESGACLVVEMTDGLRMTGRIEYFDRDMVKLTRAEGANVLLKKSDIRLIRESTHGD